MRATCMTKAIRKTVSIKDLPVPKGFSIIGGSGKKKEVKDTMKETQPRIAKLPG
jgi:hypothetical protein